MIKKSMIFCKNIPHSINVVPSPMGVLNAAKTFFPTANDMSGIIILLTRLVTIAPNAPPITTATAKSIILPLVINFLRPFVTSSLQIVAPNSKFKMENGELKIFLIFNFQFSTFN